MTIYAVVLAALPLVPYPQKAMELGGRVRVAETVCIGDQAVAPEGYRLRVADGKAEVRSSTDAGRFYAMQTLGQLKGDDGMCPAVDIEDAPTFPWRGVLIDESRHFWGKDVVKRVIDRMAAFKLNVLHWHLTDSHGWRIQIDRYPELTDRGARRPVPDWDWNIRDPNDAVGEYGPFFYTKDDIREVLAYAKARHVRVIPEIEMPGHSRELILCHPEFSCLDWAAFVDMARERSKVDQAAALCVGNDDVVKYLENILDEVVELFPDEMVHIGGDECPRGNWKKCSKCQKRIRDEGLKDEGELQAWVTRRFSKYLSGKGRRIVGWDEILAGGLPEGAVVMSWRGAAGGIEAASQGHDAVVCPYQLCYLDYPTGEPSDTCEYPRFNSRSYLSLERCYSLNPYEGIATNLWKHVLGSETLNWGESTWNERELEYKMWPRTCANAEIVWTGPGRRTFADFRSRMAPIARRMAAGGVNVSLDPFKGCAAGAASPQGESFEVVRAEDGPARLTFACSSPRVTRFDVEVNGRWAGSIAVPPLSSGVEISFDAELRCGTNVVRALNGDPVAPKIRAFRAETVKPSPGLETAKWQAAIDAAAAAGGGRVVVPAGRHLVGGLELRSNIELHLEEGAVLEGAVGLENYRIRSLPCSEGTWSAIVAGVGVTNVAITGRGEIFGNGGAWPLPRYSYANQEGLRARGLFFADAKGVRLEDFLLRDTACWGCVFKCVDGVVARRVRIDNHSNYNNDGFDIEASDAVFDSCDVDASDDAFVFKSNNPRFVVENVLVTNCVARSHCNAYKFGTASHGTMRRVKFIGCKALPPRRDFVAATDSGLDGSSKGRPFWSKRAGYDFYPAGCGIASLVVECVDGGAVEDILFDDIEVSGAMVPIFVRGGTRKGRDNAVPPGTQHVLRNITMRNIRGEAAAWTASSVSGVKGCLVSGVTLEDIDIVCRGAGEEKSMAALRRPVPDVSGGYPEATMFRHILPAYGLYVDQVGGLKMSNVVFRLREGEVDLRPPVAFGKSAFSPLEALVPRPVRAEAAPGRVKSWRALSPRVVKGDVPGAPAETADQAYRIELTPDGATVTAPTDCAAIYAKATIAQLHKLSGKGDWMPCCTITDWPRYPWRGWMIDTGRNFVEMDDLKAVLDQMAACKMNLFHWHLTEYYGWRLESKRHPELQKDSAFYLRDIGKFYSQDDFREIVEYAGARGITVMPEFDVPGHALAFRRAFGFETMRDEGVREKICDLVDELCSLAPAEKMPFIHLGTDEARLPEEKIPEKWMQPIVDCVAANGRAVVGWVPGELKHCDLHGNAVAMRWGRLSKEEIAATKTQGAFDGGACYVETFDPFELPAVATYRRTCAWGKGEAVRSGPIACCWHDENAGGSRNVIRNQVMMPAITMLSDAFWCGRDEDERGFYRRLPLAGDPRLERARELERRIALHRDLVYSDSRHPFQFLRQTDMRWRVSVDGEVVARDVAQATVMLWHNSTSGVEGAGEGFGERGGCFTKKRSGTAVLETWIRSPKAQTVGAWIGFTAFDRDHGRACSGGTPPPGKWGRYDPTVEINGERVLPPALKSAGLKPGGDVKHLLYVRELDETPYSDEEYYMREPLPIVLKEGWNHVKLTVPCKWCGSHAPWTATFVPLLGATGRPMEVPELEYRSSPPTDEAVRSHDIDDILSRMTLKEKVGQLVMRGCVRNWADPLAADGTKVAVDMQLCDEIRSGEVGALLGACGPRNYNAYQKAAMESRLGIPLLVGADLIHGCRTSYPIPLGLSCAWDEDLWRRCGEIVSKEAPLVGCNWTFAPMLDIARDARWGRIAEGAGQDPYLGALYAAATVRGMQRMPDAGCPRIAATLKHFIAYGAAEGGRDYDAADVSDVTLREIYLPPFRGGVEAGALAVMSSFQTLAGEPVSLSRRLLTDILRGELGFNGLCVSDMGAIGECGPDGHAVAETSRELAAAAVKAGLDVDMERRTTRAYADGLLAACSEGLVSESDIDMCVRRVLSVKRSLGLFANPTIDRAAAEAACDLAAHRALAREAATRSAVLLKNNGALPIGKGRRIALVGAAAADKRLIYGTWTTWQAQADRVTVEEGLRSLGAEVVYTPAYGMGRNERAIDAEALSNACAAADTVVACFGINRAGGEAESRSNLSLAECERRAAEIISASGKPFVAVLFAGIPVAIPELSKHADAILDMWGPGSSGGIATADILTGRVAPSGRLTCDFPHSVGQCPIYYNRLPTGRPFDRKTRCSCRYSDGPTGPLYPFGFGLTYTTFEYSPTSVRVDGRAAVLSCEVVNTGDRTGREVVQAYVRRLFGGRSHPVRELKGFKAVELNPGEKRQVEIRIDLPSGCYDVVLAPDSASGTPVRLWVQ